MSMESIEKIFDLADNVDIVEGMMAYRNYRYEMRLIAEYYGFGFIQTVAAFVSLSPNSDYIGNLRSLVTLLDGVNKKLPLDNIKTSSYRHCLWRAYSYITGKKDFLIETNGLKITNFYCNIIKPDDSSYVTIDGHMHNVWRGKQYTMKESLLSASKYKQIATCFKRVAQRHHILPNQLQAILWFTWKRINNIKYNSQLSLFSDPLDYWSIKIPPANIIPFS